MTGKRTDRSGSADEQRSVSPGAVPARDPKGTGNGVSHGAKPGHGKPSSKPLPPKK